MYEQRIVGPPEFRKSGTRVWKNFADLCLFYENYYFMFLRQKLFIDIYMYNNETYLQKKM